MALTRVDASDGVECRLEPGFQIVNKRDVTLACVGLLVAMLLSSFDQIIISTALPAIVGDLVGDLVGHKALFIGT